MNGEDEPCRRPPDECDQLGATREDDRFNFLLLLLVGEFIEVRDLIA